jgi:outer membrane lipoprotein-sorting protein
MNRPAAIAACLLAASVGKSLIDGAPAAAATAAAACSPATAPVLAAATEAKLVDIDARAGQIRDYAARFEQKKYTALLRKPLVSAGRVRAVGPAVRWDTESPEPSVLYVDGSEVRTYYPKQKLVEVFPLDRRMADLVSSPVPRLASLRQNFAFEPIDPGVVLKDAPELGKSPDQLAVRLTPNGEFLRQHVREVRVLLDVKSALMLCVVTVDADGDRTVVRVIAPKVNAGLAAADLALAVPADARVSRPLQGGDGPK